MKAIGATWPPMVKRGRNENSDLPRARARRRPDEDSLDREDLGTAPEDIEETTTSSRLALRLAETDLTRAKTLLSGLRAQEAGDHRGSDRALKRHTALKQRVNALAAQLNGDGNG